MKPSALSSLSVLSLLIGTLSLVGCGGAMSFSNPGSADTTSPTPPKVVAGPAVKGSVYGGHGPIQGAHVYLLQPGVTGYGSLATSLLGNNGATSANGYALTANVSDPNVPNTTAKYVTTDANGDFSLTGAYSCVAGEPVYIYAWGGNVSGTSLNNNTSIVQLLTLGVCPNNGSPGTDNFYTGSSALNFIYLNEVSTVATAYTFQPFTLVTNNDAWHIGTPDPTVTATAQAGTGINNAAKTAAQLYDIQGGQQISTSLVGEGHLANFQTQDGSGDFNSGNGVVPQATIDSLANILANCVDSVPAATGGTTAACTTLFSIARDDGTTTGIEPTDTGTAAINIARFPAGNHSSTSVDGTYAADIWAMQGSGATPYVPQLTSAPNNWTLPIYYPVNAVAREYSATNPNLGLAESLEVDDIGNVWITAQSNDAVLRWSPFGVQNVFHNLGYIAGYISIDGGNNAWVGNADSTSSIDEFGSNGSFTASYGSGYTDAYTLIATASATTTGNAFFFAQTAATTPNFGMFEYGPGGATIPGSPFDISGTTGTTPVTVPVSISSASETHIGTAYTYSFDFTPSGGVPPASVLAVGDVVPLTLTNDPGTGTTPVAGTGWQNLTTVTVASVNSTTNPTSFTATGTTATTNSNDANGAVTTAAINITTASETNAGGNYTYTFGFTNVGPTPTVPLAVGDVVPVTLTNAPGIGTGSTAATGWNNIHSVTVATVNSTTNPTSFTATGTTVTTNATEVLNITGVSETNAGGTFTYTFLATNTGATPLVGGDAVTLALTGHGGGNNWPALNGSHNVVSATNAHFVITSTTNGGPVADFSAGTGTYQVNGATGSGTFQYTNANGATGTGSYTGITPSNSGGVFPGTNVGHGAIDSAGDLWITSETGNSIARISQTGTPAFPTFTTVQQPEFPAIDNSGNAWIAVQDTASQIYIVSPTGGTTILSGGAGNTGAELTSTFGAAVDGNGNVWFANRCGNYGACGTTAGENSIVLLNGGVSTPGTVDKAISPPTNYIPQAQYPNDGSGTFPLATGHLEPILDGSLNLAIDPSGNLWITNYTAGGIIELVGAAAPVQTPLSVAAFNSKLGAKP